MFLYLFKTIMKIEEKIKATDTTENLPHAKAERRSWSAVWVAFLDWRG